MCLARSTPIDIVTAHGHKYDKQIFNDMDVEKVQQQLQEQVEVWFLLLGVKTRAR